MVSKLETQRHRKEGNDDREINSTLWKATEESQGEGNSKDGVEETERK